MIVKNKELGLIVELADALARANDQYIVELNIKFDGCFYMGLLKMKDDFIEVIYKIRDDGLIEAESQLIVHKKEEPEFIKDLDIEEDFEAKRKKAIDKILRENEEARMKISEELSTQTAAEAMASMKDAVDNLEVKKKPKRSESGWAGARPKDRHEKILKLYNEGWAKVKMAEELGIGISTVNYHLQKLRDEGKI